jgi:hypothetical protein
MGLDAREQRQRELARGGHEQVEAQGLDQGELQRAHVARRDRDLRRQLHQVRLQRTRARLAYVRQKARASPNNHCTCAKLFFLEQKRRDVLFFFVSLGKEEGFGAQSG